MDADLAAFLTSMDRDGDFARTNLIFLSDHGNSMTLNYLYTTNGRAERASPFLFTLFPEAVTSIAGFHQALVWNEQVLVGAYEVYHTLNTLARLHEWNDLSLPHALRERAMTSLTQSLFHRLPANRTCADARIPADLCECH